MAHSAMICVAVDRPSPSRVDGEHPVGVAVEGQPEVGPELEYRSRASAEVGRADTVVDVDAVGVGVEHGDLAPRARENTSPATR